MPILPCAEKLELVLSTAPKTSDNTDKDSIDGFGELGELTLWAPTYASRAVSAVAELLVSKPSVLCKVTGTSEQISLLFRRSSRRRQAAPHLC